MSSDDLFSDVADQVDSREHLPSDEFKCETCEKRFNSKRGCDTHKLMAHKRQVDPCYGTPPLKRNRRKSKKLTQRAVKSKPAGVSSDASAGGHGCNVQAKVSVGSVILESASDPNPISSLFMDISEAEKDSTVNEENQQAQLKSVVSFEDDCDMEPTFYQNIVDDNINFEYHNDSTTLLVEGKEEVTGEDIPSHDHFLSPQDQHNAVKDSIILEVCELSVVEYIKMNLVLLLSENMWTVDCVDQRVLRIYSPNSQENVAVRKSIIWSEENVQIFVHNKPLPEGHFLWSMKEIYDHENLGEVCDFLASLANMLFASNICSGVTVYQNLWPKRMEVQKKGYIEDAFYSGSQCYRSNNCDLIENLSRCCIQCRKEYNAMKAQSSASHKTTERKHAPKTRDDSLSRDEMKEKLSKLEDELKRKNKKLAKLAKKVKKFMSRKTVGVGAELDEDLVKIFRESYSTMTDEQRIFWAEQIKALAHQKNPRARRWNPFMIRLALHLRMKTTSEGYEYLQHFVALPSQRTLFDYTHYMKSSDGIQHGIIEEIAQNKNCVSESQYFSLLFDEMYIKSKIVFSRSGEVMGYVHLTDLEKEMDQLENELLNDVYTPTPAKKILVFMLQGISIDVQEVVAIYPTDNLAAHGIFTRAEEVIFTLELKNLKVIAVSCDGASMNKKFFKMHPSFDQSVPYVYVTKNFASGVDRELFFLIDSPHLLKSIRNCFANSYAHRKTRALWKNGHVISWEAIELLHRVTLGEKIRKVKLTSSHVKLTSYSCMTVLFAAQVMSNSVFETLRSFINDQRFAGKINEELLQFIKLINDMFDCLNGGDGEGKRAQSNPNLQPYASATDARFNFLKRNVLAFFDDWEKDIKKRPGKFSADARGKMCISKQTLESLRITIHGFVGAVQFLLRNNVHLVSPIKAKSFNSDKLEQYFGLLRMSFGGDTNPSVAQVQQKVISLHVQRNVAVPSSKGNTSGRKRVIVDTSALPKRKRSKQTTEES